jgi:hypothetical protein
MMNEEFLHDPELQTLAAQLTAHPPKVSAPETNQLLYACAFAAGKNATDRLIRLWRTIAAVLSILLVGALLPHLKAPSQMADPPIAQSAHSEPSPMRNPRPTEDVLAVTNPPTANLDAWQVPTSNSELLSQQLTESAQFDPHLRSLTVSALTKAILKH